MTYYTETVSRPSIWTRVARAVSGFFACVIEAQSRSREMQRLQEMTDRQLQDMNIKREDIVFHVFRNVYYF